jgi:succinate dehydrogenase flavin-adding protein (antitoxin of CptAB toxin-antitoxin module)
MDKNVHSAKAVAVTSPVHFLTEQQKIFCNAIIKGKAPQTAARMAGYSQPDKQAYTVLSNPKVAEAIKYLHKRHEKVADMSRKKVMDGMLEAIEMAKIQADPAVMINGWREIGRMCGYYAPEVKKIDINITTKRVIDKLETLSDDDLVKMIEEQGRIIESEATEVLNEIQEASDAEAQE